MIPTAPSAAPIVAVALALALALAACGGGRDAARDPSAPAFSGIPGAPCDGYDGLRWGTPADSVEGLTLQVSEGGVEMYERAGTPAQVADIPVALAGYFFYDGAFMRVFLRIPDRDRAGDLVDLLRDEFGTPVAELGPAALEWHCRTTAGETVVVQVEERTAREDVQVRFLYVPLEERLRADHGLPPFLQ